MGSARCEEGTTVRAAGIDVDGGFVLDGGALSFRFFAGLCSALAR